MLTAILSQWRAAAYGLLAAALLIAGWTANGWRHDAAKLQDAKEALRTAQERMAAAQRMAIKADEERVTMGLQLTTAELALKEASSNAKTVIRTVYVKSDPRCDLEPSIIRVLNGTRAAGGILPDATAPHDVAPARPTSGTIAGR